MVRNLTTRRTGGGLRGNRWFPLIQTTKSKIVVLQVFFYIIAAKFFKNSHVNTIRIGLFKKFIGIGSARKVLHLNIVSICFYFICIVVFDISQQGHVKNQTRNPMAATESSPMISLTSSSITFTSNVRTYSRIFNQ